MSFDDFISAHNGNGVDFDGAYGNQCMDLMHQYIYEVLELTDRRILAAPAAKDVYLTFPNITGSENFTQIANTPTGVPQKGDIMFWGATKGNPYGHVSVFIEGDTAAFNSFDQNFPLNSLCHVQAHNYKGVLGWLRPNSNVQQPQPTVEEVDDVITDQTKIPQLDNMEVQAIRSTLNDLRRNATELQAKYDDLNTRFQETVDSNNGWAEKVYNAEHERDDFKKQLEDCQKDSTSELQQVTQDYEVQLADRNNEIADLKDKIAMRKPIDMYDSVTKLKSIIVDIKKFFDRLRKGV